MALEPVGRHVERWADVQNVWVLPLEQIRQAGLGAVHVLYIHYNSTQHFTGPNQQASPTVTLTWYASKFTQGR